MNTASASWFIFWVGQGWWLGLPGKSKHHRLHTLPAEGVASLGDGRKTWDEENGRKRGGGGVGREREREREREGGGGGRGENGVGWGEGM